MAKKKARKKSEAFVPEKVEPEGGVKEALDLVDTIDRIIDEDIDGETYSKGEDFFGGVSSRAEDIGATIERTNKVSPAQKQALDNMLAGVRKWLHTDRDDSPSRTRSQRRRR